MKRVRIHKAGGYERLAIETSLPDPTPKAGEVRVAVEAIGVNFADCIVRDGRLQLDGVAGPMPCETTLKPAELRRLLRLLAKPAVLWLLIRAR